MTSDNDFINILVAEDNDVSRGLIVGTLKTQGYSILEATDGTQAIDILTTKTIDLAYVDINMSPKGGFEFIKHLIVEGIKIPVVIITADTSGDTLVQSNALGVKRLLQKPVDPALLLKITHQILERQGHKPAIAVQRQSQILSHNELMCRAIELAQQNGQSGRGRPFGAIIADENGHIVGEGTNGITSQSDPTAHAEVMAIRQASEKLGRADLSDCTLYSSGLPTMVGQALIASVRIPNVYYGLTHDDVGAGRETSEDYQPATYTQIEKDSALKMFKDWEKSQT